MANDLISIIIPCYNEEDMLPIFYRGISAISQQMPSVGFEWLFVNDGSKDDTLTIVKELSNQDERVRFLSFSRNFGKEAALYAGLQHAKGKRYRRDGCGLAGSTGIASRNVWPDPDGRGRLHRHQTGGPQWGNDLSAPFSQGSSIS